MRGCVCAEASDGSSRVVAMRRNPAFLGRSSAQARECPCHGAFEKCLLNYWSQSFDSSNHESAVFAQVHVSGCFFDSPIHCPVFCTEEQARLFRNRIELIGRLLGTGAVREKLLRLSEQIKREEQFVAHGTHSENTVCDILFAHPGLAHHENRCVRLGEILCPRSQATADMIADHVIRKNMLFATNKGPEGPFLEPALEYGIAQACELLTEIPVENTADIRIVAENRFKCLELHLQDFALVMCF